MADMYFDLSEARELLEMHAEEPYYPLCKALMDAVVVAIARNANSTRKAVDISFVSGVLIKFVSAHPELASAYLESRSDDAWDVLNDEQQEFPELRSVGDLIVRDGVRSRWIDIRWVIGTDLAKMRGGSHDKARHEEVEEILLSICQHGGSLGMTIDPPEEIGPESLDIRSESGQWIINLCENTKTDYEVRTYHDLNAIPGEVYVLGDLWDSRMICRDFAVIQEIVRTFFETGNVGVNLLC